MLSSYGREVVKLLENIWILVSQRGPLCWSLTQLLSKWKAMTSFKRHIIDAFPPYNFFVSWFKFWLLPVKRLSLCSPRRTEMSLNYITFGIRCIDVFLGKCAIRSKFNGSPAAVSERSGSKCNHSIKWHYQCTTFIHEAFDDHYNCHLNDMKYLHYANDNDLDSRAKRQSQIHRQLAKRLS